MNFHDLRGGTDTPGPGESVSAIRFVVGKLSLENIRWESFFLSFFFLFFISALKDMEAKRA